MNETRAMLIALLDDEHGICDEGFHRLQGMFHEDHQDIFDAVDGQDGRVYLPSGIFERPPSCWEAEPSG